MPTFNQSQLDALDTDARRRMLNQISGVRTAVLIGTKSRSGQSNLAIFNTLVHVGARPPLLGFVLRPTSVERHTYENLRDTGQFSLNLATEAIYQQAHQTSGNWPREVSEFEQSGLTETLVEGFDLAPQVAECPIRLIAELREEHPIAANGCRFIVGEVVHLIVDAGLQTDQRLNHEVAETLLVSGLDTYYRAEKIETLPYVKPT